MPAEQLLAATEDAPWLPPGSTAEVWAGRACRVPEPAVLVRLLVTRPAATGVQEFLCVPTPRGPDLPTRRLRAGPSPTTVADGVAQLQHEVLGRDGLAVRCIGFVRNVVPSPNGSYPYPSPWAHVPVLLLTEPGDPILPGEWFDAPRGRDLLSHRHWWRIVEHHLSRS